MMIWYGDRSERKFLRCGVFLIAMVVFTSSMFATTRVVTFVCCEYTPSFFQASVGDTVEWQGDFAAHPLESTTIPSGAPPFSNGSGFTFSYVIGFAGTYNFQCVLHQPAMAGSFTADSGLFGTKTIPGDFASIASAIVDLNLLGVGTGGVTFNVAAGHTETFSDLTVGTITATGTATNQIIFQKSGSGANPLITAALNGTSTTTDGIVKIVSGDYITFDGIDLQENSGNTTPTTQMEWGYALVKADSTNGCWHVTIKNSSVTLNKANTNSSGIYSGNHGPTSTTSFTLTDSLGTVRYCKFYNNAISNVYWGFRINGSTVAAFYDQFNEIGVDGGNSISNYGGSSTSTYGIEVQYQNNIKIANNTVNGGGTTHTGPLYGIRTGSGTNSNIDIYGNTVTLAQGTTSTSIIYGIVNSTGSSGTNNTVNIYNNIVENTTHLNSTSNSVWLIYNLASCFNLNIYGNIARNNTKGAGTGPMHCIYNSPTSPTVNAQIYGNQVYNNTSAGPIHGIHITSGTNTSIYRNAIYDIRSTNADTTSVTAGITVASGPLTTTIYNNFLSDLKASTSGGRNAVRGMNITSTTANSSIAVYYNTMYLNAVSSGVNFGSSGVFHTYSATATTATLDMRNNIVANVSTPNGTGKTAAFRRSAATNLNNFSLSSNNNCFYAGTPGTANVIFFDGTNFDQTLSAYQTRVAPRDSVSISELPPFVNTTTPPYNLHINPSIATAVDSGATPIAGITVDYDGNLRDATYPDIGADEFSAGGGTVTVGVPITGGWNLVSLPVRNPVPDDSVSHLFVNSAFPYVFGFSGGYIQRYTMVPGPGYWLKSVMTYVQDITGLPRACPDSIPVQAGWNIIGSVHCTVDTANIVSVPPGNIVSNYFGYGAGYVVATQIVPGRGYWVKASASGWIILCCGPARAMEGNNGRKFGEPTKFRVK